MHGAYGGSVLVCFLPCDPRSSSALCEHLPRALRTGPELQLQQQQLLLAQQQHLSNAQFTVDESMGLDIVN